MLVRSASGLCCSPKHSASHTSYATFFCRSDARMRILGEVLGMGGLVVVLLVANNRL